MPAKRHDYAYPAHKHGSWQPVFRYLSPVTRGCEKPCRIIKRRIIWVTPVLQRLNLLLPLRKNEEQHAHPSRQNPPPQTTSQPKCSRMMAWTISLTSWRRVIIQNAYLMTVSILSMISIPILCASTTCLSAALKRSDSIHVDQGDFHFFGKRFF